MSKSLITFKPFIDTNSGIYCHILEIDGTKMLINCGLAPACDITPYTHLIPAIIECDALLLTSFELECIGALPFILNSGFYNKVVCTLPIKVLGKISLEEHFHLLKTFHLEKEERNVIDNEKTEKINEVSEEDIKHDVVDRNTMPDRDIRGSRNMPESNNANTLNTEKVFNTELMNNISEIKYSQPLEVNDLVITAYNSGNTIGGSLFVITKGEDSIVIAYDINHRKEMLLDGVEIGDISGPSLCVVNCGYALKENISMGKRNMEILNLFTQGIKTSGEKKLCGRELVNQATQEPSGYAQMDTTDRQITNLDNTSSVDKSSNEKNDEQLKLMQPSTIIILISYSRLLELLLILGKLGIKISIISYFGKIFLERSKSMIEWCGEKVAESLNFFDFSNVEHNKQSNRCIIVIDEYCLGGHTTTLLSKYNNSASLLLSFRLTVGEITDRAESMKVCAFTTQKIIMDDKELSSESLSDEEVEKAGKCHWTDVCYENSGDELVFSGKIVDNSLTFPPLKRRKACDDYGEFTSMARFKQKVVAKQITQEKCVEVQEIETHEVTKVGIDFKMNMMNYDFRGISDWKSIKVLLEGLSPQELVLVGNNVLEKKFLHYYLGKQIPYITIDKLYLKTESGMSKATIDEILWGGKSLDDMVVRMFRGKYSNGHVTFLKEILGKMTIGLIDKIQKKLMESRFEVTKNNEGYIVEDEICVRVNEGKILLEGKDGVLFYEVRDIIYSNMVCL